MALGCGPYRPTALPLPHQPKCKAAIFRNSSPIKMSLLSSIFPSAKSQLGIALGLLLYILQVGYTNIVIFGMELTTQTRKDPSGDGMGQSVLLLSKISDNKKQHQHHNISHNQRWNRPKSCIVSGEIVDLSFFFATHNSPITGQ